MSSDGKPLFGRVYRVVVAADGDPNALDVSNLKVAFKIKKTLKPDPNTCEVKVWNLSEASRKKLENAKKLTVRVDAGYEATGTVQLYLGDVRAASTKWEGPDCVTTMTSGENEKEIQESRISVPVGAGTPVETALVAIVRALKVGEGNAAKAAALLKSKGVAAMFGPGSLIHGNAAQALTDFCRSAGLEWSIQDGQIQILDLNKELDGKAVLLSPTTGLIGSPEVDFQASSKEKQGGKFVKAECLIIPELRCGRKVVLKSKGVNGGHRIDEIEYNGDSHGSDWKAALTLRTY